jgi:hypothetical protein
MASISFAGQEKTIHGFFHSFTEDEEDGHPVFVYGTAQYGRTQPSCSVFVIQSRWYVVPCHMLTRESFRAGVSSILSAISVWPCGHTGSKCPVGSSSRVSFAAALSAGLQASGFATTIMTTIATTHSLVRAVHYSHVYSDDLAAHVCLSCVVDLQIVSR